MIPQHGVFRLKSDIRYRVVDDEGVVVRQSEAEVLVLNQTGARILTLMDGKRSVAGIVDSMVAECDVDQRQLERDVASFLDELASSGVVEQVSAAPTQP